MYKGKFLDSLTDFLIRENPDFVSMQEVTAKKLNEWHDKSVNIFENLASALNMKGYFSKDVRLADQTDAVYGNAILSRFPVLSHKIFRLKDFRDLSWNEFRDQKFWPDFRRSILDVLVDVGGQKVHVMTLHGAWTAPPTVNAETLGQAHKIAAYLKSLGNEPYIMGADMNMPLESEVIKVISGVTNNLMINSGVKQTTHPKIHKIVPRGYLVDYIFTSKHFQKISLDVPQVTISDHLPVVAELEFLP